ncbi:response regulator [Clostridium chromiireducens]|uniref:response regulator n=1 Tax=Clostridium chromiireducens TaxID=225345 RepID=UPI001FAA3EAA|nr:response regulator [Clostridium chromiireducens]
MKILIVEDEINAREGLGNLLGKINANYVVCGKASDGEQGLILAKEHKPHLIFTDIEMPKLNGLEMLEKIKEDGQNPYVIILSGYSDFKYAQKGIKL